MRILLVIALAAVILASAATIMRQGGALLAEFTAWNSSDAAVPGRVPLQGVLTDKDGVPVADGSYDIVFSLYPVATGGSPAWTESKSVTVSGGVFSTELGATTPITPSHVASEELWLGIRVGSDPEMTPRQRVGTAIYALVAQELANPKNPTVLLSRDGFLTSDITCFTRRNQLAVVGAGFQPDESVVVTALGGGSGGEDVDILTVMASPFGAFIIQGTSTAPAIPCTTPGPLTVVARGDKGSVTNQPVVISTPTPIATPLAGTVSLSENQVEWVSDVGDDVTSMEPDSTGVFVVQDGSLSTTLTGTAVFSNIPAGSKFFDVQNGAAGVTTPGTTTGVTMVLDAPGYNSTTPWVGNPTAVVGGSSIFVVGSDMNAGTLDLLVGASATTTITFQWHVRDIWDAQDPDRRRAKVTSTVDPDGEWVTIAEVVSVGDLSPAFFSQFFRGTIELSSDPNTQGTKDDGVWVLGGDDLTVTYYDDAGVIIDSDVIAMPLP